MPLFLLYYWNLVTCSLNCQISWNYEEDWVLVFWVGICEHFIKFRTYMILSIHLLGVCLPVTVESIPFYPLHLGLLFLFTCWNHCFQETESAYNKEFCQSLMYLLYSPFGVTRGNDKNGIHLFSNGLFTPKLYYTYRPT